MNFSIFLVLELLLVLGRLNSLLGDAVSSEGDTKDSSAKPQLTFIPFTSLVDAAHDTSEFWRAAELLPLIQARRSLIDGYCQQQATAPEPDPTPVPTRRTVQTICRGYTEHKIQIRHETCLCPHYRNGTTPSKLKQYVLKHDSCRCRLTTTRRRRKNQILKKTEHFNYQLCPQCPHFTNYSECELFRDSCKEPRVQPSERVSYCDHKYGQWRAMLIPADYSSCRCCDECVFFRELDQSCVADEYEFDIEEFLPVVSIDFRAGCNPYWGHPEQEQRSLRCDKVLRRCVPSSTPPKEIMPLRRNFRFEPKHSDTECPVSCRGYACSKDMVSESHCKPGAFVPVKNTCNCCGHCSIYHQLNEKCAEFKKTVHDNNGTKEVEVEEEFLEPGCDDGLVCRQGYCQDIHAVRAAAGDLEDEDIAEPCKREMKMFKKKFGPDGHLHYNAPQCTPLWLYAPVQCRRFFCYCSLADGTFIEGIKVPRVEVTNMNCDCAREKCRTGTDIECDGYGNYKEAIFAPHTVDTASPKSPGVEDEPRFLSRKSSQEGVTSP